MNTQDLIRLGIPPGEPTRRAVDFIARYVLKGLDKARLAAEVEAIVRDPAAFAEDEWRGEFARALLRCGRIVRKTTAAWHQWGENLDPEAVNQIGRACQLPVAVAGALMPDAHVGYGLPIGGVLATDQVVIPYAVGVDIACRMRMSVLDLPVRDLDRRHEQLAKAIESETRFGVGSTFQDRRDHPVLETDWSVSPVTKQHLDRAWAQLGTSGSGNHFVEFGVFRNDQAIEGLLAGQYVALLSHSGSRGTGAAVCEYYSKLAMAQHPDLSKEHKHLAWLSLETQEGQEYWAAMELMGRYAAANHSLIHHHLIRHLRLSVLLEIENHHNFAWRERHMIDGVDRDVVVHRKGATPAGQGVLGIIPGSMASPGFLVCGKGNEASLQSASHGAGRLMSRRKAMDSFVWDKVNRMLKERGVRLLSAGLDEVPGVYKDIHEVMAAQEDLVEVLGRFDPKLVKMAPPGERPED
jgi:tRNA-splicing ligase RtcB (3'-phosphate/5'-hydroxy nucleic acid ligase)